MEADYLFYSALGLAILGEMAKNKKAAVAFGARPGEARGGACNRFQRGTVPLAVLASLALGWAWFAGGAEARARYYAHAAVHDGQGVIAPWYGGLNGQCDFRVRIAAETLKRYPWTTTNEAAAAYPHYVFSGVWQIASIGAVSWPIASWCSKLTMPMRPV